MESKCTFIHSKRPTNARHDDLVVPIRVVVYVTHNKAFGVGVVLDSSDFGVRE
jgi:hypothetical protein